MNDELRSEYDLGQLLKGGVRGKYAKRYHVGTNLVLVDPDVRKAFRLDGPVNDALHLVIELRMVGSSYARHMTLGFSHWALSLWTRPRCAPSWHHGEPKQSKQNG